MRLTAALKLGDPALDRFAAKADFATELYVWDAPSASLRVNPALCHADHRLYLVGGQKPVVGHAASPKSSRGAGSASTSPGTGVRLRRRVSLLCHLRAWRSRSASLAIKRSANSR